MQIDQELTKLRPELGWHPFFESRCTSRLHHVTANLFRKLCAKFHHNCPSFVGDITENILVSFFLGHGVYRPSSENSPNNMLLHNIFRQYEVICSHLVRVTQWLQNHSSRVLKTDLSEDAHLFCSQNNKRQRRTQIHCAYAARWILVRAISRKHPQ